MSGPKVLACMFSSKKMILHTAVCLFSGGVVLTIPPLAQKPYMGGAWVAQSDHDVCLQLMS